MASFGKFDDSQFQKFARQFNDVVEGEQITKAIEAAFVKVTGMTLNIVKKNTPVGKEKGSGKLRRGWHASNLIVTGGNIMVEIYNDVEYAMYVEMGHRTRLGKGHSKTNLKTRRTYNYKPRGSISFVPGQFMLQKSIDKMQKILDEVISKTFEKELEKLLMG